jgi:hypothetical protein
MEIETHSRKPARINLTPLSLLLSVICAAIFVWTAAMPFRRAFLLTELDYNEGWNLYNTQKVALHQPLYPATYGWTAINYPALSFHLVAFLGRFTHEYLFTARILSLAGLCLTAFFAGAIVKRTMRSRSVAWLSGLFLIAWFSATADAYVGTDDPQILAQAFFMAGLFVYLRGHRQGWALGASALLFVVGGNIKHNLIEFPIAVLIDLLITSPRRALRFAAGGGLMAALSVFLTSQIDGAAYVSSMLAPRNYSFMDGVTTMLLLPTYSPLPVLAALAAVWVCWRNPERRVLALLLGCALAVNTFFSGGSGVDINGSFGSMLAMVLLCGVFTVEFTGLRFIDFAGARFIHIDTGCPILAPFFWRKGGKPKNDWKTESIRRFSLRSPAVAWAILFLGLTVPMIHSGNARTDEVLEADSEAAQRFSAEVGFLRQQPGPALCESMLRCAYAAKPYIYDPFNATRFIGQGKLDANVIVDQIKNHNYGAIQMYNSADYKLADPEPQMSFAIPILQAINQYYRPGLENEDGTIYLPR